MQNEFLSPTASVGDTVSKQAAELSYYRDICGADPEQQPGQIGHGLQLDRSVCPGYVSCETKKDRSQSDRS